MALVILVTVVVVVVVRVVLPSAMIHMAHQSLDDCLCIYKAGLWRRFCLWFSFYLCCVGKGDFVYTINAALTANTSVFFTEHKTILLGVLKHKKLFPPSAVY